MHLWDEVIVATHAMASVSVDALWARYHHEATMTIAAYVLRLALTGSDFIC